MTAAPAADPACGLSVVMPAVPETPCRVEAGGIDVRLEYGPGLTVGIDRIVDSYSFSGTDVFVTGVFRGRLTSFPLCIYGRASTTRATATSIEITPLGSEQVRVVQAPWTKDCNRLRSHLGVGPCQRRQVTGDTVAVLRRAVDIPVSHEPGGPPHDILHITRPEHAFVTMRMEQGHPLIIWQATAPHHVGGFVPAGAIANRSPVGAATKLLFADHDHYLDLGDMLRKRYVVRSSDVSRRILICAYPPVARVSGTHYGFGTPGPGGVRFSRWGARYAYEVLGPAEGPWLPVKMAREWVDPTDDARIPNVQLQLDESVPHFYPVAHLRQCLYEDWERGEWPARLPDGTPVGPHAPPISCACQTKALEEGRCDAALAAPALP